MNLREKKQLIKVLEEIVREIRKNHNNGKPIPKIVNEVLRNNELLDGFSMDDRDGKIRKL